METLKEGEKMLSLIYNSTSDIMFLLRVDENNKLIYSSVNQRFSEFTGIDKNKCIGKRFEDIFPDNFSRDLIIAFQSSIRLGRNLKTELNITINQKIRYFSSYLVPVLNEKAQCEYVLVIAQDITEWKTREEELVKLKKLAEESNRLKSTLLSNMSHEIRTPLHGILGLAEIMREELIDEDFRKMANDIKKAGKRLLNTLHSIIELSMLEADKRNVNYASIELSEVINDVTEKYMIEAESKELYFKLENLAPGIKLHIDKLLLTEIISHVLDNAVKFTKSGGIKVTVENKIENSGNYAVIKIIDTGIGISKENIPYIFREFMQESEGMGRSHEGMGLGLTLVKKMTDLMNGEIQVESEKDKGSKFILKFPAISESIKVANNPDLLNSFENVEMFEKSYPVVLMVEDNELNSHLTKVFLKNTCIVDHAADALTALQKVKEKSYDTILMDINLGSGMNGVDAVNEIRKLDNYKNIPIIAMTGYALNCDKENLLERGFTHYLAKPFDKPQLLELMNDIFASISL